MRLIVLALAALLPSTAVRADCQAGIAAAIRRTNAQPPSAGRAAMLEQIQRADVARHEDDESECLEQLKDATAVLDQVDEAKKRAAHGDDKKAAAPAPNGGSR